ncbi:MAG: hypothetical protein R8G66_05730 [Cytophagales bacterium]|nr:hypothetical protein [Cytophagales bacterium]
MKDLSRLIHAVTDEESESVIRYYSLNNNGSSKRLKLFNMVRWKDINDDRLAAKKLYNSRPCAAFSQLKKRLKEDILNILLSRETATGKSPKNFVDAEAQALKYVLYGKMLLNRGLTDEAVDVLKKAFKLARDHEAFEVEALAHSVFKTYSISQYSEELADAEQNFAEHVDDFYQLMRLNLQSPHCHTIIESKEIPDKRKDSNASIRLSFLLAQQQLEGFLRTGQYYKAQEVAESTLHNVRKNGHLLSSSQKARFYLSLSKVKLGLEQFDEVIYYGRQSSELFKPFEENKLEALTHIFKGYFHCREQEKAKATLKTCNAMAQSLKDTPNEIPLFQAYLLFREMNFRGSLKSLNQFFRLSKSPIEVVLNGRMLELQNLVETEDYDWFDYKLDSFRKLVKYHACEQLSERFTLIYKVFTELKRCNYQKVCLKEHSKNGFLNKLSDKNSDFYWNSLGSELVPVHRWLMGA